MLISHRWIRELTGIDAEPEELARKLTFSGLEVEGVETIPAHFEKIVVGEILSRSPHPERDRLSVVEVSSGEGQLTVVCGAPNCPGPGGRVVLALPGARVGDVTIERRKLGGVESSGMICSEMELGIGPDHEGILVLPDGEIEAAAGTPIGEALGLGDAILEIGVTPNRPDALSHRGVAREVALLYGKPFEPAPVSSPREDGRRADELATVEIVDARGCPRYGAAVVLGVRVGPSPFRVRYRLHNLGLRPISNLVDMTNWIVLEYGQPLHAFDLDELEGKKIIVRKARDGEKMTTLDEVERQLTADDLLICDGARPVAVAGVMGGLDTGITEGTRSLLIECAYFEPSGIRRTSKRLKLSSESSYRFERGVDPAQVPEVLLAATSMSVALAGGKKAPGLIDRYPVPIEPRRVEMRPARFTQVMGYEVAAGRMREIFAGLGAEVSEKDEALEVTVPTARPDITREIDLIEEVARIHGLHEVRSELPRIRCLAPQRQEFEAGRRAREILSALGLSEAICYSFVPGSWLEELGAADKVVTIANPLNSERATMRTTLLGGLIDNLARAHSRFLPGIKQFEVGRTFHEEGEELPREVLRAAGILSGPAESWIGEGRRALDVYDAKGIVEAFVRELSGAAPAFEASEDLPGMHPKRALVVKVGAEVVGKVGELHPRALEGRKLGPGACVFELDIETLWARRTRPRAEEIASYPPLTRDVSLLVDEGLDAGLVEDALRDAAGELASEVRLIDIYRGEGIRGGKKSITLSVTYRSKDRTLTDEEVDGVHVAAVALLESRFDATQR
jgi:phenylalanyl-tRNA synthetase beta chain